MKKSLLTYLLATTVFNNSNGWKLDADGKIEMKDGNPVYVDSSGRELTVDQTTISRLNGESKTHREAKEAAEAKLKAFEGIDPEIARKALETVGKLDAKKLIDAGEVDKVRQEISGQFTTQLNEKDTALKDLQGRLDAMHINGVFANSEFLRESVAVPRDMFEATFRNSFKVEDGQVHAYDKAGNRLMSKTKAGEYATPEEALQILVEAHPQKDVILKSNYGQGSGSGGGGGNRGGSRNMKRGDFERLPPNQQAEVSKKVHAGEMTLTD